MQIRHAVLLPLLLLAQACGGGSGGPGPLEEAPGRDDRSAVLPSDLEIASRLYDPYYHVPDDFFVDERAATDRSYTLHHVMDDGGTFERCSDDFGTAQAWEQADNASRAVQGYYVGSHETERYFEFIRELAYTQDVGNITEPTSPGFARVFKCSNTNRDGVDRSAMTGFAGTLNSRPVTAERLRVFAEYFWQFTYFPQGRKKVIASHGDGTVSRPGRSLLLAFSTRQGVDRCDLVEVAEWRFTADRDTGRVEQDFAIVRRFEAELLNGAPALCD